MNDVHKVRVHEGVFEALADRVDWGEPDEEGFYTPTLYRDYERYDDVLCDACKAEGVKIIHSLTSCHGCDRAGAGPVIAYLTRLARWLDWPTCPCWPRGFHTSQCRATAAGRPEEQVHPSWIEAGHAARSSGLPIAAARCLSEPRTGPDAIGVRIPADVAIGPGPGLRGAHREDDAPVA